MYIYLYIYINLYTLHLRSDLSGTPETKRSNSQAAPKSPSAQAGLGIIFELHPPHGECRVTALRCERVWYVRKEYLRITRMPIHCSSAYIDISLHMIYAYVNIHIYICIYMNTYIHIYTYIYVCIQIYTYIHTCV